MHGDTLEIPAGVAQRWWRGLRTCACGWRDTATIAPDDQRHKAAHRLWLDGIALPEFLWVGAQGDAITVMTQSVQGGGAGRTLAEALRTACMREVGSLDGPFVFDACTSHTTPRPATLYLAVTRRTLVGFALVRARDHIVRQHVATGRAEAMRAEATHLCIDALWVAVRYRRRGIGTRLVGAVSAAAACAPSDLAWLTPFGPDGLEFAATVAADGGYLWLA